MVDVYNNKSITMTLIDFFDKCRYWGIDRNPFLNKLKFYSICNYINAVFANLVLPVYFFLTKNNCKYKLINDNNGNRPQVIVSLTSFPKRFRTLHLVIECLFRQTVKPDKIILYLTASQVGDLSKLPHSLLSLQKRGLEIQLCPDNIRSHTKYFYAMQQFPDDIIITVDDDLFYRSDLIECLLTEHRKRPNCIIANWTKDIIPGKDKYKEWPDSTYPHESKNQLLLGVRGVLYPPYCLHPDVFNVANIQQLALTADDVWLTAMALLKGTPLYSTDYEYNHLPVHIINNETLISGNYVRNQEWIDKINIYYLQKKGINPFIDIPNKINYNRFNGK